jgi:hypothetical protein
MNLKTLKEDFEYQIEQQASELVKEGKEACFKNKIYVWFGNTG